MSLQACNHHITKGVLLSIAFASLGVFAGIMIRGQISMRYTVILEQEADGGYVATVPALPGCVSQGDTRDEVMRNIHEAADLYIEDCIAAGDPVPTEAGREYFELDTRAHR
jgi:predicted RNase H-like HicB family nuclease